MKQLFAAAAIFAFAVSASQATAQALSAEDIAKLVDERVNNLNPYQALLNDPDPKRSLAAMQIMLESGDPDLTRMALEFGLLSPNPTVKRIAFEAWLTSGPILSFRFDGTEVEDKDFTNIVRNYWNGTLSDNTGYWRIAVGDYLPEQKCYANTYRKAQCFIPVNSDGVFLTPDQFNARATISDTGRLEGTGSMYAVDEPVPFSIQLID